jgi:MFS family permease
MFGLTLGLWAVHIPTIAGRLHLDPAILGLALLNVGLGGVFSQPLTGWLIARSGSLLPARILVPLCLVVFVLPIVAWSVPVFFLATLLLGAAGGANNVAINTQASEIERARGKPTMSSFHGFFSLGALGGASLGGAIIAVHRQDGSGAAAVIAVLLVIALVAGWYFLRSPPPPQRPREPGARRLAIPSLAVLSLSVLVFFSNTVEGAVNDWSALYLSTVRGFEPATAVSGFALFSLAMAFCRLAGGRWWRGSARKASFFSAASSGRRHGHRRVLAVGDCQPARLCLRCRRGRQYDPGDDGAASRSPGTSPSAGVAATATGGLLGFLIGPPIIGFIAHALGLSVALGFLSLAGVIVFVGAALLRWPPPQVSR